MKPPEDSVKFWGFPIPFWKHAFTVARSTTMLNVELRSSPFSPCYNWSHFRFTPKRCNTKESPPPSPSTGDALMTKFLYFIEVRFPSDIPIIKKIQNVNWTYKEQHLSFEDHGWSSGGSNLRRVRWYAKAPFHSPFQLRIMVLKSGGHHEWMNRNYDNRQHNQSDISHFWQLDGVPVCLGK